MPSLPPLVATPHTWLSLAILAVAVLFYARGRQPIALVSAGLLTVLIVAFQVAPFPDPVTGANLLDAPRLLLGFSNPALVTVVALLVVGEGVARTGAVSAAAPLILRLAGGRWQLALALSLVFVAVASAFLNNAPVVVIFMPILATLAADTKISVSKLLMPLSFVSILGGTCTLIGTSTNILVAAFAEQAGLGRFDMFEFSGLGVIVLGVGLVYLIVIAPLLLPDQAPEDDGANGYGRFYLAQMEILTESPLANRALGDAVCEKILADVHVSRVIQGGEMLKSKLDEVVLRSGDLLLLVGSAKELKQCEWDARASLIPPLSSRSAPGVFLEEAENGATLAEVVVLPESSLVGRTLTQIRFRHRFGPAVIGIHHNNRGRIGRITERPLRAGDLLLIQGFADQIDDLSDRKEISLFLGVQDTLAHPAKARVAAVILAAIVVLAVTHAADMLVLSLAGAFLMLATRCLSLRHAYAAVSPPVVLVVAATLGLGEAMQVTGAAEFLAQGVIHTTFGAAPGWILTLFILMVMVLTNLISNNAAAILFAPIAISVAGFLGVSPMPFLIGVVFGANAAFATPMGYKTNLLVMGAGGYGFSDFLRVGLPLNLLVWILVSVLIPVYWPF